MREIEPLLLTVVLKLNNEFQCYHGINLNGL